MDAVTIIICSDYCGIVIITCIGVLLYSFPGEESSFGYHLPINKYKKIKKKERNLKNVRVIKLVLINLIYAKF